MTNQQRNTYLARQMGWKLDKCTIYDSEILNDSESCWILPSNKRVMADCGNFHDYPGCFGYLVPYLKSIGGTKIQMNIDGDWYLVELMQWDEKCYSWKSVANTESKESLCQAIAQAAEQYFMGKEDEL